jgi:Arylsulfotransferase (ASST)
MKKQVYFLTVLFILTGISASVHAYEALVGPTGVLYYDNKDSYGGYTLFAPNASNKTYLIDMEGNRVHTWKSETGPGLYAELLPNGNLLRGMRPPYKYCGIPGTAGGVEEIDWNGKVVWKYKMASKDKVQHHCFNRMPNGNTLILGWERISNDVMISKGRNPKTVPVKVKSKGITHNDFWLDFVEEVNPAGQVVWEWHCVDHLGKGSDQLDPNFILPMPVGEIYATSDWSHFNSVEYVPETDQVLMNSRNLSEIYLVNHKTGKIEYRWGNKVAYGQGKPASWYDSGDQILSGSHDARYIGDGRVSIFDNGSERPEGHRSRIVVLNTKTDEIEWEYRSWDTSSFSSHRQGAAQLLPNGNWFVTSSNSGHLFEITKEGKIVWDFVNPIIMDKAHCTLSDDSKKVQVQDHDYYFNMIHRAYRYGPDYPGLQGRDLSAKEKLAGKCPEFFKIYQ